MAKRILMIEDDREMVTLGKLILEREGYEVLVAYGGAEGLELLRLEYGNVDLLLLDIMMTGMDGWQVLTEVKADEKTLLDARTVLAEVYISRGDTAKAIGQYRAVAAAAKEDDVALAALFKVAEIYERAGDRSAAIETYGEIVESFGEKRESAKAQFRIGENLRAAKLYKESNTALEKLVRKWPQTELTAQGNLYRGLNLLELGAPDEAVKPLAAAAAVGPRSVAVQSYYFLGVAERDQGNDDMSREYFGKVLTNYRDFPEWVRKARTELTRR